MHKQIPSLTNCPKDIKRSTVLTIRFFILILHFHKLCLILTLLQILFPFGWNSTSTISADFTRRQKKLLHIWLWCKIEQSEQWIVFHDHSCCHKLMIFFGGAKILFCSIYWLIRSMQRATQKLDELHRSFFDWHIIFRTGKDLCLKIAKWQKTKQQTRKPPNQRLIDSAGDTPCQPFIMPSSWTDLTVNTSWQQSAPQCWQRWLNWLISINHDTGNMRIWHTKLEPDTLADGTKQSDVTQVLSTNHKSRTL